MRIKEIRYPENIKIWDVRKGLPFSDNTAEAIFSSHLLEHMNFEDGQFLLKESYRCLRKGGVIRIIVPDLYQIAKKYVFLMETEPKAAHSDEFLQHLNMHDKKLSGVRSIIYRLFGHSKHLYMYDEYSLRHLFDKNGFKHIERMNFSQSRIPEINLIEDKGRFEMSVCLEGVKE